MQRPVRVLALAVLLPALVLLLPSAAARPPCPVRLPCRCTNIRIKCLQPQGLRAGVMHYLAEVPYFSPLANQQETRWQFDYHEMRIRDQAMTQLSLRYDWGLLRLARVEVTSSLVRSLAPDAFRGLHGIESLNLSYNLLTSLSRRDLDGLVALRELVLHGNRLKTLQPGVFRSTPGLSRLYLSDNQLDEVPPDLHSLSGLTHLYLQRNNISRLPDFAFDGLRRLIILDLGGLRPGLDIRPYAFCGLSARTASEEPDVGGSGSGLVALFLRDNWLARLDLCALGRVRSLQGLNLTGSRFPCDCHSASLMSAAAAAADGAGVGSWPELYGFAPRYVAFDSTAAAAADCSLDAVSCPPRRACTAEAACPTARQLRLPANQQAAAAAAAPQEPASLTFGDVRSNRRQLRIDDGTMRQAAAAGSLSPQSYILRLLLPSAALALGLRLSALLY